MYTDQLNTDGKQNVYLTTKQLGFSDKFPNTLQGSIDKVDLAMKDMDDKFNTQFYSWIRNENNVDYISYYLRRIIQNYDTEQSPTIIPAILWLVKGWKVSKISELFIKLFYHWGISNPKFCNLILALNETFNTKPTLKNISNECSGPLLELILSLVVGEKSSKVSKLMFNLSKHLNQSLLHDLIFKLYIKLGWSTSYFKSLLCHLIQHQFSNNLHFKVRLSATIKSNFLQLQIDSSLDLHQLIQLNLNLVLRCIYNSNSTNTNYNFLTEVLNPRPHLQLNLNLDFNFNLDLNLDSRLNRQREFGSDFSNPSSTLNSLHLDSNSNQVNQSNSSTSPSTPSLTTKGLLINL